MATLNKKSAIRVIIFVLLLWGLILAIIGSTHGNVSAVTWHLEEHKEAILSSKIDSNILNCWTARNRTDFTLVLPENQCDQPGIKAKCYNLEQLKDLKWVRKNLRGFKKTLIVGGNNFDESLLAAATLAHYGYETRMLAGDIELAYNEPKEASPETSVASDAAVVTPVAQSADAMDEEEEEEEEGC
jgi:hypothetical protein